MTETETLRLILFLIVFYHLVKWGNRLSQEAQDEQKRSKQ